MDGSARLHTASASAPAAEPWKSLEAEVRLAGPSLSEAEAHGLTPRYAQVIFESGRTLQFFGCTLSRRRQAEVEVRGTIRGPSREISRLRSRVTLSQASVSAMRSLDVSVSEGFDAIRAAGIIGQQGDRPLCDVLLDQSSAPPPSKRNPPVAHSHSLPANIRSRHPCLKPPAMKIGCSPSRGREHHKERSPPRRQATACHQSRRVEPRDVPAPRPGLPGLHPEVLRLQEAVRQLLLPAPVPQGGTAHQRIERPCLPGEQGKHG